MTTKQATAIKHIVAGDSASKAMRKAGYKPSVAKNPQVLTRSKNFRETLEKFGISDEKLAERLNEGLDAVTFIKTERVEGICKNRLKTEDISAKPDYMTRHRYLETSIRLKGHEKDVAPNTVIIPIYGGMSGRPEDVPLPRYNSNPQDLQTQATH